MVRETNWHHTIHYKTKIKTGNYSFTDDEERSKQVGELEIIVKVPQKSKATAENISNMIMTEIMNPRYIDQLRMQSTEIKSWTLYPEVDSDVIDTFEKKVVGE